MKTTKPIHDAAQAIKVMVKAARQIVAAEERYYKQAEAQPTRRPKGKKAGRGTR